MKKLLLLLCLFAGYQVFPQMPGIPDSINYQAVLRDGAGNVLAPGTPGTLNFRIYSDLISANPDYEENHTFTTNAVGLVNLYIGGGSKVGSNTMANVNWASGTASYEVRLNGTLIGARQAFASVPYALYARSAGGGSLPLGLQNQTLHHDGVVWKPTNNLANDGTNIGIGIVPTGRVRLNVVSGNNTDSTVISAFKGNAYNRDVAIKAKIIGTTSLNLSNPDSTAIFGGEFIARNFGQGYGVGASGIGSSSGLAVGLSGVATGGSTLIGVYGSAEPSGGPNKYAAYFNKGKVVVNDGIMFPTVTNTTTLFYTLNGLNEGVWAPLTANSSSISITGGGIVSVSPAAPSSTFIVSALPPVFTSTNIGNITMSSYPNYQLNIPSPTLSYSPTSGLLTYLQAPIQTSVNISPSLTLFGSTLSVAGSSINIPALNYWTRPTLTVTVLGNSGDNVGIGTSSPTEKLVVQTNTNVEVSIVAQPLSTAFLNLGSSVTHTLGRISYNTSSQSMSFWTNNAPDRLFINNTGNVGINTNIPNAKLDINGDFKLGATGNILTKVIGGQVQPIVGTINPNVNQPVNFAAAGAAIGDRVVVTMAGGPATSVFLGSAAVSAINQITVNLFNAGGTAAPGGTYTFNYIIYK